MKTTIPQLRKMIRKVIVESMSPSDPDYEMVAEVISQVKRQAMFGQIHGADQIYNACVELANDYGVSQHIDYIAEKVITQIQQMLSLIHI